VWSQGWYVRTEVEVQVRPGRGTVYQPLPAPPWWEHWQQIPLKNLYSPHLKLEDFLHTLGCQECHGPASSC
jgi:hypothetical protein